MGNVWKIGSNWGQWGENLLDMFMNYECVFFGDDKPQKIGDWNSVTSEDLFLICDGHTTVALGRPTGKFKEYKESRIHFTAQDIIHKDLECSIIKICPAQIVVIPIEKRFQYKLQYRFCKVIQPDVEQKSLALWNELSRPNDFNIIPRVASLFCNDKNNGIFNAYNRYRIPIYQRPYMWSEKELRALLEDLRDALETDNTSFMGTMQLSQPIPLDAKDERKAYNIIDGQQRITSFIILKNVLEKKLNLPFSWEAKEKMRTLVSLGEEQRKLEEYVKCIEEGGVLHPNTSYQENRYIANYLMLDGLLEEYFGDDAVAIPLNTNKNTVLSELYRYISGEKIIFVVIETHATLSKTLKIFNTINTAGLDLGVDDLFKIRLYEYLKNKGKPDSVFDDISELYARIERYNMLAGDSPKITMGSVLRTYQHILFAREGLNQNTFYMSYEKFFEQLFDTLLGVRTWSDFSRIKKKDNDSSILSLDDLNIIIERYIEYFSRRKDDYNFRIIRDMYWETRYGYVWDFPIVARFFNVIAKEQLFDFMLLLFKWLCPPSLYKLKVVNPIRSELLDILKELANNNRESSDTNNGLDILKRHLSGTWKEENKTYKEILREACGFAGATFSSPKWKNLLCRLVEYLKSPEKDEALYNRLLCWPIDIEHIQCVTDEFHPEDVQTTWGKELNSLGNLVILERHLNRGIKNRTESKNRYDESDFNSVKELCCNVGLDGSKQTKWTKEKAETRRKDNTKLIIDFIFGINN